MKFFAIVLTLVSGMALACSDDGKTGFLPENTMSIPVGAKTAFGGLSQAQFNGVISKVTKIYAPVVSNMGGRLVVERLWTDGTVNAYAKRDTPKVWTVQMFGGLARHSAITEDGFALVLCHELGHHIGGAPKKRSVMSAWSSPEGQADYFATLKCLRHVFLNDNNAQIIKTLAVPADLATACNKAFSKDDANICIRSGMAGASVATLFASMGSEKLSSFSTPDRTSVSSTFEAHPATQCRLDTFFQGSLCTKSFHEDVSQTDEVVGTCHGSTNFREGLRPRCWFKPKAN